MKNLVSRFTAICVQNRKAVSVLGLLLAVCALTTIVNGTFVSGENLENLMRRTALFGFISIGVSFVIITGGIDLSIGSVIALTGCLLPMFLTVRYVPGDIDYPITQVEETEMVVTLSTSSFNGGNGDRLRFETDDGKPRHLTIVSTTVSGSTTAVKVREFPSLLAPGKTVRVGTMTHMSVPLALGLVLAISLGIGLLHGLLVTRGKLQPFVVTLCGLMIYRGMARFLANDQIQGFGTSFEGLKYLATGKLLWFPVPFIGWISKGRDFSSRLPGETDTSIRGVYEAVNPALEAVGGQWVGLPLPMLMLFVAAVAAAVFLNKTIYGRYLLALGRNEEAARYSGINTGRMVIIAYVICGALAGFSGILFALDLNSVQPSSHANFYELYAIAAAVLGGCSLRGGEGSILGVVVGAAIMRVLYNSINLTDVPITLEFVFIGSAILIGVVIDDLAKRVAAKRRGRQEAMAAEESATKHEKGKSST